MYIQLELLTCRIQWPQDVFGQLSKKKKSLNVIALDQGFLNFFCQLNPFDIII